MQRAPAPVQRRRYPDRIALVALMVMALVGALAVRDAGDAGATAADEAAFVNAINGVRANVGLPPLVVNNELANLARAHAQTMADADDIFHASPISAGYTGPWSKIGENVGVGANVSVLVDAFVASPGHYANIVDPAFTEIGVGVVWKGNALYTTHRFLQVSGPAVTTPPSTTAPPAPPTTAPPPPSTTAPGPPPTGPTITTTTTTTEPPRPVAVPLAPPDIDAARVVTLLDLLELVGT